MRFLRIGFTELTPEDKARMLEPLSRPRVKPGECDHPKCTGVHSHTCPREEWCPRTRDRDREWDNNTNRALYKSLHALRSGIDAAMLRVEELEGPSAYTQDQSHWDTPLPSGARIAYLRTLQEKWAD